MEREGRVPALPVQVGVEPHPTTICRVDEGLGRSLRVVWRAVQGDVGESSVIGSVLRPSDE